MDTLHGVVANIVFRNEDNGYTVFEVEDGLDLHTAVGSALQIFEGMQVRLEGEWKEHAAYGRQFDARAVHAVQPDSLLGVQRYLASGIVSGVGPVTAQRIVEAFGAQALDVLRYHPGKLAQVRGISPKKAADIAEGFARHYQMQDSMVFLQSLGVTSGYAARIYKRYGAETEAHIRNNPYALMDDVDGIGFRIADRIAREMGVAEDSPVRTRAAIKYILQESAGQSGHTCLPKALVLEQTRALVGDTAPVEEALARLVIEGGVDLSTMDGESYAWLPLYRHAERDVAQRLVSLARTAPPPAWDDPDAVIARTAAGQDITLSDEQIEAVHRAALSSVSVITGGPGTGKTTVINCIIDVMHTGGWQVALAAPTGRAAKRMSEATGHEAKTLHRLLEYAPGGEGGGFSRNESNPIEADMVIVDEMSMVDILLMQQLLRAVEPGCRLVLVGDADQLPSVGPGNVLRDIISSAHVPVVRLGRIYRQAEESLIITNAHRVNQGEMPVLNNKSADFFFERRQSASDTLESVLSLVSRRLHSYKGYDSLHDIQVLAPMKKGDLGVNALNSLLQNSFNPKSPRKPEMPRGDMAFRLGDKVMQIKNNYSLQWTQGGQSGEGVFNGDMGFISHINTAGRVFSVEFDDGRLADYNFIQLEELQLAYAVSIHKSQGSEFPAVVLPLVGGPPMLMTRNLLYTAITRAREMVVICGREDCIARMVNNNLIVKRYSGLPLAFALLEGLGDGG